MSEPRSYGELGFLTGSRVHGDYEEQISQRRGETNELEQPTIDA